jgi:hypothetical protein
VIQEALQEPFNRWGLIAVWALDKRQEIKNKSVSSFRMTNNLKHLSALVRNKRNTIVIQPSAWAIQKIYSSKCNKSSARIVT